MLLGVLTFLFMPNEGVSVSKEDKLSSSPGVEKSFISNSVNPKNDTVYGDFFQETSDGNITIWARAQKSNLEIFTTIVGYIIPVLIIVSILWSAHVYLRNQENGKITENYPFLCSYLNYGIKWLPTASSSTEGNEPCKSIKQIGLEYEDKQKDLSEQIVKKLAEYIPIKITKNIILTSPERTFIINTYRDKVHMDAIIDQFEAVRKSALSQGSNNIECNGLTIAWDGKVTTQCTVYGWEVWDDDTNGKLWSARIEALRFVELFSETSKSQFILLNPPTSMSMEDISDPTIGKWFQTRTTVSIVAQYVKFNEQP